MKDIKTKLKLEDILSLDNLADKFTVKEQELLGMAVLDGYTLDKQSREGWEDKVDEWMELALQVAKIKTTPWPDASNVKYPLLTTAALQFASRAYPALLPNTNLVRGRVIGFDHDGMKLERAIRVGKHMSYQLLEEMPDWEEEMDKLLFSLPIIGCMFKKTYFDGSVNRNVSEVVFPKELVVNYFTKTLEDAPRISHELAMSTNDIHERVVTGVYLDIDLEEPQQTALAAEPTALESSAGIDVPATTDATTPYKLIEQHLCWDLDKDGYEEPYVATIEAGTGKILRIVARFDSNGIETTTQGDIIRIKPLNYFTKFSFIPSPDGGFYDLGFGVLLGPINDTINTTINQLLDAGSMSNMQAGFIARGIRIKGGNKPFTLGEWKTVNSTGDDLRKGIVPLPVRDPSNVLFSLLGTMITAGEKLSSVTDMMTGEIPGQNTKATVAMAAIEQGMKVFSSIYKRNHRSLSKEYKKLFYLNSLYVEQDAMFTVLDVGQERAETIQTSDYSLEDVDVVPASDPNMSTEQQKLAKVQAISELLQMGTINRQEFTKRYLEALEEPNIEALMNIPPPEPNPEFVLKGKELNMQQAKDQDQSARDWKRLQLEQQTAETEGLLNLANAEKAEMGQQLDFYKMELETLKKKFELEKIKQTPTGGSNGNGKRTKSD